MAIVFKFGGASVKDADSVRNLTNIVRTHDNHLVIVVSAMGKMTRAMTKLTDTYYKKESTANQLNEILLYHQLIIKQLFDIEHNKVLMKFQILAAELEKELAKKPTQNYDFEYDQIVQYGELFSTFIVSHYLNYQGIVNSLIDARKLIKTNSTYRDAKIDWKLSEKLVIKTFDFNKNSVYLTQGFIASDKNNYSTTLGLEGSDYTAAAISYILNAEKMVVWKDVAGVYSSDPNQVEHVTKLDAISYTEAVELAYYGAKVIHPKTIKPLQNKNIPLYVKSFITPGIAGTVITGSTANKSGVEPEVPVFITKNNQILISIAPNDFSFIAEDNLEHIFSILAKNRIKVNLMQNSAISFSVCTDKIPERIDPAIKELRKEYKVLYNEHLTLITIRHYNQDIIDTTINEKQVYVQQKSRHTARFVVK